MAMLIRMLPICVLIGLATPLSAAVIERDWLAPGDGLLTYDTVNNREWLDLTETILAQFPGGIIEFQYPNVVSQTGSGGQFEGFVVATESDVVELAVSAGIDINTLDFNTNEAASLEFMNLLGATSRPGSSLESIGFFPVSGSSPLLVSVARGVSSGRAGLVTFPRSNFSDDRPSQVIGVYLYRNAVPEPAASTVALLATFLLSTIRSRSKANFILWLGIHHAYSLAKEHQRCAHKKVANKEAPVRPSTAPNTQQSVIAGWAGD